MTLRVVFWSYFQERTGTTSETLEVPEGTRVSEVLAEIHRRWPMLEPLKGCTLVAVGVDYADPERVLEPGDEISLFPPVQGG